MNSREDIEPQLKESAANSFRLTTEHIYSCIWSTEYHVFGGTFTVCCITLQNGYKVIGESACLHPDNFNAEIGETIAFNKARDKIWELEGYLLKSSMSNT